MTNKQNTFIFVKAGLYDGISHDFYSEIVRYCQTIDKPFLKKSFDLADNQSYWAFKHLLID